MKGLICTLGARFGQALALSLLTTSLALAYSTGPPDGFAGEPPQSLSCTACHGSNVGDGSLALLGVPAGGYNPGATYTLTVRLADPGQSRWGFELVALTNALNQAGAITVTDNVHTQLSDNPDLDPDYLKHTSDGTYPATPGPTSWSFDWQAPITGESLTFYVAGNAANNNGSPSGDYIYLLQVPVASTTGIEPATVPAVMFVGSSFPNPAPAGTAASVRFALEQPSQVVLRVVDAGGRVIAEPMSTELGRGVHLASWNGRSAAGLAAPRGVYFFTLRAAGRELVSRLVVD
jgi:hypothetical protein